MKSIQPNDTPYGVPGQINIYVLDVDSEITSYGKHNRLLVFLDRASNQIEIREDNRGLPASTEAYRRKIANGDQRMHPKNTRLTYLRSEQSDSQKSIWHYYAIESLLRCVTQQHEVTQ